jgi:hypothetical protein
VPRCKGLETKDRLQFQQVLAACLGALAIVRPRLWWHLQLRSHHTQQRRKRLHIYREHHAGKAHVAELYREAKTIGWAAPLPDDGEVGFVERVVADQVLLGFR